MQNCIYKFYDSKNDTEELDEASQDKEDLKQMHNNYMLQVQSLINQRAISAPSESTRKGESKPAPKEDDTSRGSVDTSRREESRPAQKEANTKEVICLNCGKVFTAARSTRMYCSGACKEAYRRKMKKEV